jgi:GNAT superfamily N-acetyltransferase
MLGCVDDLLRIDPMRIRLLRPNDEPFLWDALYYAIYVPAGEKAPAYEVVQQRELARYVEGWMTRPGDSGFVAVKDGRSIGAAWLRRWTSSEPGFGFVDEDTPELSMAVLPSYRGCGTGTTLLRRLSSRAARNHDAVSLSVSVSNPARRLYEREGFVAVAEPSGGSITMMKRFAP